MRPARFLAGWCGLWYLCLCALLLPHAPNPRPAFVPSVHFPPRPLLEPPPDGSLEVLLRAQRLVSSTTGPGGILSAEGIAWRAIASRETAGPDFERLLSTGSVAGRLYALAWFHRADPALFRVHANRLGSVEARVDVLKGCILRQAVLVRHLVLEIARGDWTRDLEAPNSPTRKAWGI